MIHTVRGLIHKNELGKTMPHEHFKWEIDESYACDMYYGKKYDKEKTVAAYNKILPIVEGIKNLGCDAIVEASPPIGGQNLPLLYQLSKETGMHIIPCTGWNTSKYMASLFPEVFVDIIAQRWINDINIGLDRVEDVLIQAGYIKLLLDKGLLNDRDTMMLKAAAIAGKATGAGIHCHILEPVHVRPVIVLLKGLGYPMERFLWAHADIEGCRQTIQYVAKTGAYIGFDKIHEDVYPQRLSLLQWAINQGYENKILLSEDYDFYEESLEGSAPRSGALFSKFIPYCIKRGISIKVLDKILSQNPSNFYDIKSG